MNPNLRNTLTSIVTAAALAGCAPNINQRPLVISPENQLDFFISKNAGKLGIDVNGDEHLDWIICQPGKPAELYVAVPQGYSVETTAPNVFVTFKQDSAGVTEMRYFNHESPGTIAAEFQVRNPLADTTWTDEEGTEYRYTPREIRKYEQFAYQYAGTIKSGVNGWKKIASPQPLEFGFKHLFITGKDGVRQYNENHEGYVFADGDRCYWIHENSKK